MDYLKLINDQLKAYNNQKIEHLMFCYAYDVRIYIEHELVISGVDDLRARFSEIFEKSPELVAEILEESVEGNIVYQKEKVTGHIKYKVPTVLDVKYVISNNKIANVYFSNIKPA